MNLGNRFASASGSPGDNNVEFENSSAAVSQRKRGPLPSLASVVGEALEIERRDKQLRHSQDPFVRGVEVERLPREQLERLTRILLEYRHARPPSRQISIGVESHDQRILRLKIGNKLPRSVPLFTGQSVKGEDGTPISIVLQFTNTGQRVTTGPESAAKLEVVVLDGDFANEKDEWKAEEFEQNIVKERKGKGPLLAGDSYVILKDGFGLLGDLAFTDNSSWTRSKTFRLGFRVVRIPGDLNLEGVRVHECKTEAFPVKDQRGRHYEKHYPPALDDEIWRLEKIHKDGTHHKRLQMHHINTVDAFLRNLAMDPQKLRSILGLHASSKAWDAIVAHAKTCSRSVNGKMYVYYYAKDDNEELESCNNNIMGVVFNSVYEPMGMVSDMNGDLTAANDLSEDTKMNLDALVKAACTNWQYVKEYKKKGAMNFDVGRIHESSSSCYGGGSLLRHEYNYQVKSKNAQQMMNVPSTNSTTDSHADIHNHNRNLLLQRNRTCDDDELIAVDTTTVYDESSRPTSTCPPPLTSNEFDIHDNEFMKLLWECDGPTYGFPRCDDASAASSSSSCVGKAYVSWLKLKSLFRWGIFKRKQPAADDDETMKTRRGIVIQELYDDGFMAANAL